MEQKLRKKMVSGWPSLSGISLYFVLVVLCVAGTLYFFSMENAEREEKHLQLTTEQQRIQLRALTISFENIADVIFQNHINRDEILAIMARANSATEEEQTRQRELLWEKLSTLYENLYDHGVRQFHFHLPEANSFLRFHHPSFFGESLQGVRHSIERVNETRLPVRGFEEGKNYYGFRNVYPLHFQGKFVGTMEISYSFLALRKLAVRVFPAIYTLILHKDILLNAVLKSEQSSYRQCFISESYLKHQDVVANIKKELPKLNIIPFQTLKEMNKTLGRKVEKRLLLGQEFSVSHKVPGGDKILLVTFLPIKNVKGENVAYFISYKEDSYLLDFKNRYMRIRFIVTCAGLFLLLAGGLYHRQEEKKKKYMTLATTDSLTSVPNRRHFDLVTDQVMREAKRKQGVFSLVILDIDDFKKVNDTFGHEIGDQVLMSTAALLRSTVREQDLVARWGGEEFVILLPGTSAQQACIVVEKVRRAIASTPVMADLDTIMVTCSFGVTQYVQHMTKEDLFKKVDMALYQAKKSGKNRIICT
ncbi:MAG: diguanylate cyclase [Desulfobulbaceae bacterium]|nr:diguanylate cyclase [Desulfobulbaceae bacterium]